MKVKRLIALLQEADPSGELEVTGWAGAILSVDRMPGYYDGPGNYFEESEYYPEKMYIDYTNDKIVIHEINIKMHLVNSKKSVVEIITNDKKKRKRLKEEIEQLKEEIRNERATYKK